VVTCTQCGEENAERARFCNACGSALTAGSDPPRDVRKVVTVLFCDVVGSTALGERLDPEALRAAMTGYFGAVRAVIERHGGTVEKFIGDAVMAVFGVPDLHEDDALRAVRAAAEIRAELERLAIPARIGINTGEVVVVAGGDLLVTGDAVNVAARLEQAAGPAEVLIGESTYRLVSNAVQVEQVEPLAAKGKAEPLVARRLLNVDGGAPGFARRMDAPLIGREPELSLLAEAYERASRDRHCHLFTLLGVAGAGKSRLISEFLTGPAVAATALVGHCLSYGEGITFWPLAEMVRSASGIADQDSATTARAKLDTLLATVASPGAAAAADRVAWAIGLDAAIADVDEIAWATRKLFEWLAAEAPVVVIFEDVHWAESTLLDLIENIADLSRGVSLLIVCSARPELLETRPGWAGGKSNATSVLLEPLNDSSTLRLIDTRGEALGLTAQRRSQIVAAAEGNPLFVEQMLATLGDDPDSSQLVVPGTIQALLAARLDGLDQDERHVLESASVEGRVFHRPALTELVGERSAARLTMLLQRLIRRQLIVPERVHAGGDEAFRFQHQLIRDAAYAHMSKRDRAGQHERYAEWLQIRFGERGAEYEEIVAYHLEQAWLLHGEVEPGGLSHAELATRAGRLLASAGRRARDGGDTPSAAGLLTRARVLVQSPAAERCLLLLDLSRAHVWNLENEAGAAVAREALDLATDLGDAVLVARAEIALLDAESDGAARDVDFAVEADSLVRRLTELGDDAGLALAWQLRTADGRARMQAAAAIAAGERALTHARRSGQRSVELETLLDIAGQSLWGSTPVADAIVRCRQALDTADDPRRRAKVGAMVAALEAMRGHLEEARASRARRQSIDADLATRGDIFYQAQHWAIVDTLSGDHAAAEAILRASIEEMDPDSQLISINRDMMAHTILAQGRFDEADELARQSERAANRPSEAAFGADWRRIRARVLAHRGHHDEAVRRAREASALMTTTDYLNDRAATELDLSIVLHAAGERQAALEAAMLAIQLWALKGNTVAPARARTEFGLPER
jgi:class 3 adenylate cyclase/tetratricopeptide (TPR) repeat protein